MALQILYGFTPVGFDPYAIGTGYYVLIEPAQLGLPRSFPTGERCWLPGKQPRKAVKATRPKQQVPCGICDQQGHDDQDCPI